MERHRNHFPSEEFQVQKAKLLQEPTYSPYYAILDKLDSTKRAIERIGKLQTSLTGSGASDAPAKTYEGVCQQLEDA